MQREVLFDDGHHRWIALGRDPHKKDHIIDTNEYLIISNGEGLLLDPGGTEIFPNLMASVADIIHAKQIKGFFASHQDPDVFSSLPLWMMLCSEAKVYVPKIWSGFIAHFGYDFVENFEIIPDEGMDIQIGTLGRTLKFIPAHFCHSSANFSVYDPSAKILFSGDIGAAILPENYDSLFVTDFDRHMPLMEGFHRRWMPSNAAKNAWIRRVRELEIEQLCPQHGAIFRGPDVKNFLDWFERLEVGVAVP